MLEIKITKIEEAEIAQSVYINRDVSKELGEFVMLEGLKQKIRNNKKCGSVWHAVYCGDVVGVCNTGSRANYTHLLRHGEIAVLQSHHRMRIGTSLHTAKIISAIVEGRRQLEGTIIENNPNMHHFLPMLGYKNIGILENRTKRFKSIYLYQHNSYEVIYNVVNRLPENLSIQIVVTDYTREIFNKNMENYKKDNIDVYEKMNDAFNYVMSLPFVEVIK